MTRWRAPLALRTLPAAPGPAEGRPESLTSYVRSVDHVAEELMCAVTKGSGWDIGKSKMQAWQRRIYIIIIRFSILLSRDFSNSRL